MAFTKMGIAAPAAATFATLYTVPTANTTSATLVICNGSTATVEVDVAISALATPTASEYVAKGLPLASGEVKELTLVAVGDELVVVKSTGADVSFRLTGTLI
jgi:hypothetical protein